jgi:hypothetical protein
VLAQARRLKKEKRTFKLKRRRSNYFVEHFIAKPKDYQKKTVRNDKLTKVAEYKISTQKSVAFLYANNETNKNKIR